MTAAIIAGAVVLALAGIALLNVHVVAGYADYPYLFYRVGPLTIPLVDKDWISEDLTDHAKRDKWQEKRKKQIQSGRKKGPVYRKKDLKEMAVVVKDLIAGVLRYVRKYACLESLHVRILAASDDAAKTGILYGETQAMLASLTALLDCIPEKRKKPEGIRLEAECDFVAEQMELDAEISVTMHVWQALVTRAWYTKEITKLWELMIKDPAAQQPRSGQ